MEKVINPILQSIGMNALEHHVIRKIAHITEFFVFSVFASQLWDGNLSPTLLTGFVVAFLDESIQLLSNRGSQISDVWIDLIGVVTGAAVGHLIWRLSKWINDCKLRKTS